MRSDKHTDWFVPDGPNDKATRDVSRAQIRVSAVSGVSREQIRVSDQGG